MQKKSRLLDVLLGMMLTLWNYSRSIVENVYILKI